MNIFAKKFNENIVALLPIFLIVLFLNFTILHLDLPTLVKFVFGSFLILFGLTFFLVGVDLGIAPLGDHLGVSIAKSNKLWLAIFAAFILGFFISIAEPGLLVLAQQVEFITIGHIKSIHVLLVVSLGLAVLTILGFIRILYNIPLYKILIVLYVIIGIIAVFVPELFLNIAFDASGATTGILAVPFILALSVGISKLKKDSKSSEKDAFGLIAIASIGAILGVLLLGFFWSDLSFEPVLGQEKIITEESLLNSFIGISPQIFGEAVISLLPMLLILILMKIFFIKFSKRVFIRLLKGFFYAVIGLSLFLIGARIGFMNLGFLIGEILVNKISPFFMIVIAFFLGFVTIIAEPAVNVLTHQIEEVTSGYIKRRLVIIPLAIGVGLAVSLATLRIVSTQIMLWHILLPGYLLSMLLMFVTPKLFVGIAFDAGGVATGPMTATFILAFTQGIASEHPNANILIDGFGMIALVAMVPIITLEVLGIIYKIKSRKVGIDQNE